MFWYVCVRGGAPSPPLSTREALVLVLAVGGGHCRPWACPPLCSLSPFFVARRGPFCPGGGAVVALSARHSGFLCFAFFFIVQQPCWVPRRRLCSMFWVALSHGGVCPSGCVLLFSESGSDVIVQTLSCFFGGGGGGEVGCLSSARMVRPTRPMGRCHEVADACDRPSVSSLAVQSVLCGVGGGAGCLPTPLPLWPCTGGSVSRACALWPRRGRAVRPSAAPQPVGWPVHERCPRAWAWPLSRATGWMGRIAPVMHFGIARPFLF